MKAWEATIFLILRVIVLVIAPLVLVYLVNMNYPGLIGYKTELVFYIVILLAVPAVILHFFGDITQSNKKVVFESISLTLLLIYTYLLLGSGSTHLYYKSLDMELYYPILLYIIIGSIAIRYPTIFLRYYAEKSKEDINLQ